MNEYSYIDIDREIIVRLHETFDGEWDYTIYTIQDGGLIGEGAELTVEQAIQEISKLHNLGVLDKEG